MQRTFLLTGCASGIGRDLADTLIEAGHRVLATDVDIGALQAHAEASAWPSERAAVRRLDVTDPVAWDAALASVRREFGALDVLCNIAGTLQPAWVHEVDEAAIHRQVDVNLKGIVFGIRAVAPAMIDARRGHIINVASLAALAPIPGIALYSATKYAVRAYSLAAAQELRPHGVYVSVVCPDAVRTPMLEMQRDYDEAALTFSGSRVLEPREVTEAMLRCLEQRPLEMYLPRHRGLIARVADILPQTSWAIAAVLRRRGLRRQKTARAQ